MTVRTCFQLCIRGTETIVEPGSSHRPVQPWHQPTSVASAHRFTKCPPLCGSHHRIQHYLSIAGSSSSSPVSSPSPPSLAVCTLLLPAACAHPSIVSWVSLSHFEFLWLLISGRIVSLCLAAPLVSPSLHSVSGTCTPAGSECWLCQHSYALCSTPTCMSLICLFRLLISLVSITCLVETLSILSHLHVCVLSQTFNRSVCLPFLLSPHPSLHRHVSGWQDKLMFCSELHYFASCTLLLSHTSC